MRVATREWIFLLFSCVYTLLILVRNYERLFDLYMNGLTSEKSSEKKIKFLYITKNDSERYTTIIYNLKMAR